MDTHLSPAETIHLRFPQDLEIAFDALWTANEFLDAVGRIDVRSLELTTIPLGPGFSPQEIEVAHGSVWVSGRNGLVRIAPETGRILARIDGEFKSLDAGLGSIWTGGTGGLARIDPRSNSVVAIVPSHDNLCVVSVADGSVWMSCSDGLRRIDPATNTVAATLDQPRPGSLVLEAAGAVWLVSSMDIFQVADPASAYTTITAIDTDQNVLVPGSTRYLAQGASSPYPRVEGDMIWFPVSNGVGPDVGMLFGFDAATAKVVERYDLSEGEGIGSNSVGFGYGSVWTASGLANRVRRWLLDFGE